MSKTLLCTAALTAAFVLQASPAQAALINLDVGAPGNGNFYATGAGVFGSATSQWNSALPQIETGLSLLDDTGAATTVKVSYAAPPNLNVGIYSGGGHFGTYSALGSEGLLTLAVNFEGLNAGAVYDLVIYSGFHSGDSTFTVGGTSLTVDTFPNFTDWSSLNAGRQYVQFSLTADSQGQASFTPGGSSYWSALQLRQTPVAPPPVLGTVPEPGTALLAGLALLAAWGSRSRAATKA